jgi:oligosaccharide repeat unit polymerase
VWWETPRLQAAAFEAGEHGDGGQQVRELAVSERGRNSSVRFPERAGQFRGTVVTASVLGWLAVTFGSLLFAITVESGERLKIVLPAMAATGVAGAFTWFLGRWHRSGFQFFEVGVVYVAIVWLYTVFPLVGFLVNGLQQNPTNDMRLYIFRPSADELGSIGWYHVVHLAAFAAAYLLWRGRAIVRDIAFRGPDRATVMAAMLIYLAIVTYVLFLHLYFDLSARTYLESYLVHKRLPLVHAQLINHLSSYGGARFILELVFLAALFANYRRWRLVIAGWLGVMASLAFVRLGSRTELVLFVGALIMMYHYQVRRLRFWNVVAFGVIGVSVFLLLGALRSRAITRGYDSTGINPIFGYATEFENNFANAYDLARLRAVDLIQNLPPAFYLVDLLAFVPQQLLPIEKISPAVWYVTTFYPDYAASGGGMAFGSIAESVLGGGWLDAVGRGGALGLILALVYRWHTRSGRRLWPFILYVWLTLLVYNSFRGTTFMLLGLFVYRFVPVWLGVTVVASMLRAVPRRRDVMTHARPVRAG